MDRLIFALDFAELRCWLPLSNSATDRATVPFQINGLDLEIRGNNPRRISDRLDHEHNTQGSQRRRRPSGTTEPLLQAITGAPTFSLHVVACNLRDFRILSPARFLCGQSGCSIADAVVRAHWYRAHVEKLTVKTQIAVAVEVSPQKAVIASESFRAKLNFAPFLHA